MRRWQGIVVLGLCALLGLGFGAVGVAGKIRRDAEWAHGGDRLTASAQVRATDAAGLPATIAALGGPSTESAFLPVGTQALVIRLRWTGPEYRGGRYNVLLLDRRLRPAPALDPYSAWAAHGKPIWGWDGRYGVLLVVVFLADRADEPRWARTIDTV
jgi:hypothetical protein